MFGTYIMMSRTYDEGPSPHNKDDDHCGSVAMEPFPESGCDDECRSERAGVHAQSASRSLAKRSKETDNKQSAVVATADNLISSEPEPPPEFPVALADLAALADTIASRVDNVVSAADAERKSSALETRSRSFEALIWLLAATAFCIVLGASAAGIIGFLYATIAAVVIMLCLLGVHIVS